MSARYRIRTAPQQQLSTAEDLQQDRQWSYEEAAVRFVLRHYRLTELAPVLWNERNDSHGFGRLTFEDFQRRTHFPALLRAVHLRRNEQPFLADLLHLDLFPRLMEEMRELTYYLREQESDLDLGVVFPVVGLKFLVIHTFPHVPRSGVTYIQRPGQNGARRFVVTVERLADLLAAIRPPSAQGRFW